MTYPGGKNGAGVYQTIINAIPPHHTYVECFAGSAAIYRHKAPAATSFLIEANPDVANMLESAHGARSTIVNDDALAWLDRLVMTDDARGALAGFFFYFDPPYLHSTRRDLKLYGNHELTDEQHAELLTSTLPALTDRGALWALSGYRSTMYDDASSRHGWHRMDYQAMTRRGVVTESLWTNYRPQDLAPAELTYLGDDFRERERLKRKRARWVARLAALPELERQYLFLALANLVAADDVTRSAALAAPDDARRSSPVEMARRPGASSGAARGSRA